MTLDYKQLGAKIGKWMAERKVQVALIGFHSTLIRTACLNGKWSSV